MDDNGRSTAYADLLSALLALRADPATARFDAELAAAEAAGLVDGSVARTLRWWQRESMRGLADHLAAVLPDLLTELLESDRAAAETVRAAQSSWAEATALLPTAAPATSPAPAGPGDPHSAAPVSTAPPTFPTGPHLRPVDDIDDLATGTRPPLRKAAPSPPGSAPVDVPIVTPGIAPGIGDHPVGGHDSQAPTPASPALRPGFAPSPGVSSVSPPTGAGTPVVRASDGVSSVTSTTAPGAPSDGVPASSTASPPTGAPRTRLLVAGLTVLSDAVSDDPARGAGTSDDEAAAATGADNPDDHG